MTQTELQKNILMWAQERGLLKGENAQAQTCKLLEEAGELAGSILKQDRGKMIDAIGDIQVVLIILSSQLFLDYNMCLEEAWNQIKDRTGKTQNGTFIKDGN